MGVRSARMTALTVLDGDGQRGEEEPRPRVAYILPDGHLTTAEFAIFEGRTYRAAEPARQESTDDLWILHYFPDRPDDRWHSSRQRDAKGFPLNWYLRVGRNEVDDHFRNEASARWKSMDSTLLHFEPQTGLVVAYLSRSDDVPRSEVPAGLTMHDGGVYYTGSIPFTELENISTRRMPVPGRASAE